MWKRIRTAIHGKTQVDNQIRREVAKLRRLGVPDEILPDLDTPTEE